MEKIKSMFEKIHHMHICCGVICTTHIPFVPTAPNIEKNDITQMQVMVDPRMRFMDDWFGPADSKNQLSLLHDSEIFKESEKGDWLNGIKLKAEDLPQPKADFNKRHSATTTCALEALVRFADTWKYLQGETSCAINRDIIHACCILHNIVIDMEDDAAMPRPDTEYLNYC
nr:protein ALP1-like [Aegilops tauschii subsp. strangulata]